MSDNPSPQTLSNLIGSIYDCALDPARWEQTLVDLKEALHCENAILHLNDVRQGRILVSKIVGIEPYWVERIMGHSEEINARLVEDLASWPSLDQPHVVSRHLPPAYVEASPYIRECWKPQGIVDVMTYFLMHSPARFSGLALGRHERHGIIGEREIELGGLLLPHIRRAVTISNVLDASTIERARMAEALDALRCGVVLTDARGAIVHANRAAEHMLRNGAPVQGAGGILQAKTRPAADELRAAIRLAARDETGIGKTGLAIRLTGPDVPPMFAHVLPMNGGDLRTRIEPAAVAAVFIGAPLDAQDGAEMMAATYHLTPAETRLLASLLAGHTLAETGAALDIAESTAKTHLNHIFAKTGVARQADLVRLASQMVPPTAEPGRASPHGAS